MSEYITAFLLGVVEGLTEFIPVSSTGHLILFGEFLEFDGRRADTFSVFIQLGAILAVIFLYPNRFKDLFNFQSNNSFAGLTGIKKVIVASIPALIAGFLLYDLIKEKLFNSYTVAIALILGGIVLIFIEKVLKNNKKDEFADLGYKECCLIGVAQCFALWPGMSRSGSTIVGAMLVGCNKKLAAEFSFFLAVPIMFAAVSYDLLKSYTYLSIGDLPIFLIGFIVSFVVAILAIKFFIALLEKYSMAPLGVYRVALGVLVLFLSF